jgi:chemotaxis protein CheX
MKKFADESIEAFVEGVSVAFREMAGAEVILGNVVSATGSERFADITAILKLTTSTGLGQLILSLPEGTAIALACRILDDNTDIGMVCDCMGEVANVIAGQAKTMLVRTNSHFILSTPTVVKDDCAVVGAGWHALSFESELGRFALYIDLPSRV